MLLEGQQETEAPASEAERYRRLVYHTLVPPPLFTSLCTAPAFGRPGAGGPDASRAQHHTLPALEIPVRPLPELRGLTPARRAVLAALATAISSKLTTTASPLSVDPALAPFVNALSAAPYLHTLLRTPLPALWALAILNVAGSPPSACVLAKSVLPSAYPSASSSACYPADPHPHPPQRSSYPFPAPLPNPHDPPPAEASSSPRRTDMPGGWVAVEYVDTLA
ncbi:hypothetical protein FB451DRAFT_1553127 [Mycena latifolia]|nr:hypothetical protein FB451DRAFT_1553127 [Mycena latifolia]